VEVQFFWTGSAGRAFGAVSKPHVELNLAMNIILRLAFHVHWLLASNPGQKDEDFLGFVGSEHHTCIAGRGPTECGSLTQHGTNNEFLDQCEGWLAFEIYTDHVVYTFNFGHFVPCKDSSQKVVLECFD